MHTTHIVSRIFVNLLIFCLVLPSVLSIGISPGRTLIAFTPQLEHTFAIDVTNSQGKEIDVILYTEGELSEYITLSKEQLHLAAEQTAHITSTVKLPNTIGEPGMHKSRVIAREIHLPTTEGEEIVVKALLAVSSAVDVRVPYPGKYLKTHFYVSETEENQPITFLLQPHNLGTEDIKNAQATIAIINAEKQLVTTVETESRQILSGERIDLATEWIPTTLAYGNYVAQATINYDGFSVTSIQGFQTGKFGLQPIAISVKDFTLGDVAKFNVLVKNLGNDEVEEAITQIIFYNNKEVTIADFASAKTIIPATAVKALISYWDTEGVKAGSYEGTLVLTADEATTEKRLKTTVTQDAIQTEFLDITGKAITSTTKSKTKILNTQSSLALFAGLIILANILGWHIYYKRRDRGKLMDDF